MCVYQLQLVEDDLDRVEERNAVLTEKLSVAEKEADQAKREHASLAREEGGASQKVDQYEEEIRELKVIFFSFT